MKDKQGRLWDFHKISGRNSATQLEFEKQFDELYPPEVEIQQFVISLPYVSRPVWPQKPKVVTDFSFCVCPKCGFELVPNWYYRLCLSFTVVQYPSLEYEVYWRPRLSCCDSLEYPAFEYVLCVEQRIKPVFNEALQNFKFRPRVKFKKRCYVCEKKLPCDNAICKALLESGKVPQKPTCDEYFYNLMLYMYQNKVDIVSPLIERKSTCSNPECTKMVNPDVFCQTCRYRAFCSKRCRAKNLCVDNFLKIWKW